MAEQYQDPSTSPEHNIYTLEPLRTDGPDALDPTGIPGIREIRLCEVEIASENTFQETTITRADDLFASATLAGRPHKPIPAAGNLTRAAFELRLEDSDRPHAVTIRPPHTLSLEVPTDATRVLAWLEKHGFRLTRTLTILLLAVASAFAPALDDGDDDEDDIDTDRLLTRQGARTPSSACSESF